MAALFGEAFKLLRERSSIVTRRSLMSTSRMTRGPALRASGLAPTDAQVVRCTKALTQKLGTFSGKTLEAAPASNPLPQQGSIHHGCRSLMSREVAVSVSVSQSLTQKLSIRRASACTSSCRNGSHHGWGIHHQGKFREQVSPLEADANRAGEPIVECNLVNPPSQSSFGKTDQLDHVE